MKDRLAQQVAFLLEIDKLKTIFRRTSLVHAQRFESQDGVLVPDNTNFIHINHATFP